jgi:hypothetical protein
MPPKMQELEQAAQPSGENTTIGLQYDRYINNTLTRVLLDNPTIQTLPRRGPGRPRVNKAPEQKRAEAAERARKYRNRKREKNENNQSEAEGSGAVVGNTAAARDETVVSDQGAASSGIGPSDTGDAIDELRRQLMNVIVSDVLPGTQDSNIASKATTEEADNASNKSLEGFEGQIATSIIFYI